MYFEGMPTTTSRCPHKPWPAEPDALARTTERSLRLPPKVAKPGVGFPPRHRNGTIAGRSRQWCDPPSLCVSLCVCRARHMSEPQHEVGSLVGADIHAPSQLLSEYVDDPQAK